MQVSDVVAKLTSEQQSKIVDKFVAANPHWDGAKCDDILYELDNVDANLDVIEPLWESFPDLQKAGFGYAVLALHWSGTPTTEENISALLN